MIRKRKIFWKFLILILLFVLIIILLGRKLPNSESKVRIKISKIEDLILKEVQQLESSFTTKTTINDAVIKTFINELNAQLFYKIEKVENLVDYTQTKLTKLQLYDLSDNKLRYIKSALKNNKIIKADVDSRGTQLKLLLHLEGDIRVIFKPKWYNIDEIINGPVYSGKDRFNSEIVAFYLSGILQKPLVPISTIRKISIQKDIIPVATTTLRKTIYFKNGTACLYGKCFYCNEKEPVCEENGFLTGAVILNINRTFNIHVSPWRRTYKDGKKAPWEEDNSYCLFVATKLHEKRIADLIDVAIFDFLIQNGDRHRYETLDGTVLWIDNGKGLGNPHKDFIDILAPLYQCCRIKSSTWNTLVGLSGGRVKYYLEKMPDIDELITQDHLHAIERRMLIVYATVEYCRKSKRLKFI